MPDDMDGRALTHLFAEPCEPDSIASYEPAHPRDGVWRDLPPEERDPFAARQAMEQLAALGYIEMPDAGNPKKEAADALSERRKNLVQVYFSSGRWQEALALLHELIDAGDNHPQLRCHAGLCYLSLGQPARAEAEVASLVDHPGAGPLPRLVLGRAKLALNQREEAQALLEPLRREEGRLPFLMLALGHLALRNGDLTGAEESFRRALERDEFSAGAHDGLGIALRRLGRYEDAVYEHMRAASLQHDRAQTHLHLGLALVKNGQTDWAVRAFEVSAELASADPLPPRMLARLFFSIKKDRERARHHAAEMLRRREALRERQQAAAATSAEG